MRFIYLTDTHIGANPVGYHQQPAYPEKIAQLLDVLSNDISHESVDFVIHGGDMVDYCQPDVIQFANEQFTLPVPTFLCLGNHDLDRKDALDVWMQHAPNLFVNASPNFKIIRDSFVIHVVPNQWEEGYEYYWNESGAQFPHFTNMQVKQLIKTIEKHPDKKHIIITHSPVFGMDKEQSGLDEVLHNVPAQFQQTFKNLVNTYPNIKMILSGHSHFNTIKQIEETLFVNVSSFVETPFNYKVIDITDEWINIETRQIDRNKLDFTPMYNKERAYVQGKNKDKNLLWYF